MVVEKEADMEDMVDTEAMVADAEVMVEVVMVSDSEVMVADTEVMVDMVTIFHSKQQTQHNLHSKI
jgi:hypothetical protein